MEFSKLVQLLYDSHSKTYGTVFVCTRENNRIILELMNEKMYAYYYEDDITARTRQDGLRIEFLIDEKQIIQEEPDIEEFNDAHGAILGLEFTKEKTFDITLLKLYRDKEPINNIVEVKL